MALALLCVKKKERYSVFKFYNPIENYELGKQLHLIWCWYSSVPTNVSTSYSQMPSAVEVPFLLSVIKSN